MFLKTDGSLWATGANYAGQFGAGADVWVISTPMQIMTGVKAVSASVNHTMILKRREPLGAGMNYGGELGAGELGSEQCSRQIIAGDVDRFPQVRQHG